MALRDEEDALSYVMILFFIVAFLIVIIKINQNVSVVDKEFKKQQEDIQLKVEKCKMGKVVSIDEANTTIKVKNKIRKSGEIQLIPGSYEQTVVVPQYYVKLDNGITLVSQNADLKMTSEIGKKPKSEFCNEDIIQMK